MSPTLIEIEADQTAAPQRLVYTWSSGGVRRSVVRWFRGEGHEEETYEEFLERFIEDCETARAQFPPDGE